uniref:Uncharacterized protein n=1 Tax=Molossus molossus TaxID=27622 RepID=A0A7J8GRH6_MOLMO|nr:hypothetical protein HJG59_011294 [Molossus molossus]
MHDAQRLRPQATGPYLQSPPPARPPYWHCGCASRSCAESLMSPAVCTTTSDQKTEKDKGEIACLPGKLTLSPEHQGPLDIEWLLLSADNQKMDQVIILYSGDKMYGGYCHIQKDEYILQVVTSNLAMHQ